MRRAGQAPYRRCPVNSASGVMKPQLREAQGVDYVAVAGWIYADASTVHNAALKIPLPILIAELQYRIQAEGGKSFGMLLGEDLIAFGQYSVPSPGEVHFVRLIVSPGFRRKGYGRSLCTELIEHAVADTGARVHTMRVDRDNIAGRNLCASFGFQVVSAESDTKTLFLRRMHRTAE